MITRLSARRLTLGQVHAVGAAALAAAILAALGIASPTLLRFVERADAAAAAADAAANLARSRSDLEAATAERAALAAASRRRADAGLPAVSASLDDRVDAISQLAAASRVSIESIEPGAPTVAVDVVTPLNLSGRARYLDAIAFLRTLRTDAPDLSVQSVQFSASGNDTCAFRVALSHRAPTAGVAAAGGRVP